MKKFVSAAAPAMCFLIGFLVCALVAPMLQGANDGESYHSAIGSISFLNIFWNNSLMCCLFILACGIGSCILLLIQGFTFGSTYILWLAMGNPAGNFFRLFLPHVVFEFIAMTLAGHLGFRLLDFILKKNRQSIQTLMDETKWLLAAAFAAVLIGALVECYVTPVLYTIG